MLAVSHSASFCARSRRSTGFAISVTISAQAILPPGFGRAASVCSQFWLGRQSAPRRISTSIGALLPRRRGLRCLEWCAGGVLLGWHLPLPGCSETMRAHLRAWWDASWISRLDCFMLVGAVNPPHHRSRWTGGLIVPRENWLAPGGWLLC